MTVPLDAVDEIRELSAQGHGRNMISSLTGVKHSSIEQRNSETQPTQWVSCWLYMMQQMLRFIVTLSAATQKILIDSRKGLCRGVSPDLHGRYGAFRRSL